MATVLLVGEHSPERGLEAAILRRYGFEVRATSPAAALQSCASDPPTLVLAPAGLRAGDGRSLTTALREVAAPRDLAVLCVAATLEESDLEMERGGADLVLLRPVRARKLVEELTLLAERRPLRSRGSMRPHAARRDRLAGLPR